MGVCMTVSLRSIPDTTQNYQEITTQDFVIYRYTSISLIIVLPSFSPPHRKNDQKSYRGAKLTTRQTIASTSPVHVKRSSPISQKNSLAKSETFSQKSIASRSLSPVASC